MRSQVSFADDGEGGEGEYDGCQYDEWEGGCVGGGGGGLVEGNGRW